MTLFHLKRKLLKALGPVDRLPGPPLHVKAHHGPFGQWNNPEHLQTLQVLGLKVEDSVLDYGCGAGRMAEHLFKWGVKSYLGFDCNAEALKYAQRHYGYPGYFFVHVKAGSELYADNQEARSSKPETTFRATAAIAQSLITHTLPGETVGIIEAISQSLTLRRAYISLFTAQTCKEAAICGAKIPLANGVWVKNKHNMSAIVAYSPDLFRKLCDGWEVTYSMGRWRDMDPSECSRRKLPYQDYAILTR